MQYLSQIYLILLTLIVSGGIMRIAYCFVQIMINGDERGQMVQRIKNAVLFLCISAAVGSLAYIIANNYFGLGSTIFSWF